MNDPRPARDVPLVRAVLGLPDNRLSCEQCQTWLPSYVDAEIGGVAGEPRYRPVKHHLLLCSECTAIYLELLALTQVDEEDRLPQPEHYPEPDLSFLPSAQSRQRSEEVDGEE